MVASIFGSRIVHSGLGPITQISREPSGRPLTTRISFKDLCWSETGEVHGLLKTAAVWEDFPSPGYKLVRGEFKAGDEDQRLDLLYLRDDGALLPCELKIGGKELDTAGQLLRYIADMHFQTIDMDWLRQHHSRMVEQLGMHDIVGETITKGFDEFVSKNGIGNRQLRFLPRSGLIMDENFPSQLRKTIRYLNEYCGFSIRMWKMETFVSDGCCVHPHLGNYLFRLDFTPID